MGGASRGAYLVEGCGGCVGVEGKGIGEGFELRVRGVVVRSGRGVRYDSRRWLG